MKRIFRITNVPVALSLAVVATIWIFAEIQNRSMHHNSMREDVLARSSLIRARLEAAITADIQLIHGLIAVLNTEPDMDQERFSALASGIMREGAIARNLALAPDMIVQRVHPFAENRAALGLNYLEHPEQSPAALRARDTGQMVMAGPVELLQGGQGFVVRIPVFMPQPDGSERFWGLVATVLDTETLYAAAGLLDPMLPINVALRGRDASGAEGDVFFGDETVLEQRPVQLPVSLPVGSWDLLAAPRGGWSADPPDQWTLRLWLILATAVIVVPGLVMARLLDERVRNVARLHMALRRQGEANARFENVSRISRSFVWEQDADHRLSYLSSAYQHLTGFERRVMLGRTMPEIIDPYPEMKSSADWEWLYDQLRNQRPFSNFICLFLKRDGSQLWVQLAGGPIFDEDGRFRGFRGAGMDVTSFQQARQTADEANRMKSMFLANMSHEIRTPLNGVLGMAQVLESMVTDPEHRHMVTTIRESGESLQNILNDILDLSKIEAGKLSLESAPFVPEETLCRIAALHRLRAEEKGLEFRIDGLDRSGPARVGDRHRFTQILHNLLGNAIKFTESGRVHLALDNAAGAPLRVTITDTGPGMTADEQTRIFDEFVQGDDTIARRHGGTGLGMSIVHRLLGMMGGKMELTSHTGEGTRIALSLPLAECAQPVSGPVEAETAKGSLAGLRLLAADDNRTNRRVLEALLRETEIAVTFVENGQEAVEAARRQPFDLMMLDISMPVMDGIEARARIEAEARAEGRTPPPAIAFTANVMAHQLAEYSAQGFVGYVGKPLKKDLLLRAIRNSLLPQH